MSEINQEPVPFPEARGRVLKSELIQWKSLQCKGYLDKKRDILKRLETKLVDVCSLLNKLSAETCNLSHIFRELDIQETTLNFKMKYGFSWKKRLKEFKQACREGRESASANAWQFGVELCSRWSISQKIQSLTLQKELKVAADLVRKGAASLHKDVFDSQEVTNSEYVYEQKKLRNKKNKLLQKSRFGEWGIFYKFQANERVLQWLKSGESWVKELMCWEESSLLRHLKGVFEVSNSASFLQLESFQMLENSLFYHKFLNIGKMLRDNFTLVSQFLFELLPLP